MPDTPPDLPTRSDSGPHPRPGRSRAEGWQRLRQSLISPSRSQLIVGVLLAAVGFASVTQVRFTELDDTYAGKRDQDLIELWNSLALASQRSEAELARLERLRDDLRDANSRREAALTQARQEADSLDLLAGLVPVEGPGIRITITETAGTVSIDALLDMVQELRSAAAEGMEFNDRVRVVAQTAFDVVEDGVVLDGVVLSSPYTVDVIGDPRNLADALTFPTGPISQFEDNGATVAVQALEKVTIESVRQPVRPQYAEPDDPK